MRIYTQDLLFDAGIRIQTPSQIPNAGNAIDRNPDTYLNSADMSITGLNGKTYNSIYIIGSDTQYPPVEPTENPKRGRSNTPADATTELNAVWGGAWRELNKQGHYIYRGTANTATRNPSEDNVENLNLGSTGINRIHEVYLLDLLYDFNWSTSQNYATIDPDNSYPEDLAGITSITWSYHDRGGGTNTLIDGTQSYYQGIEPGTKRTYHCVTDYRSHATVQHLLSLLKTYPIFTVVPDFDVHPDVIFQATLDREPQIGYTNTLTSNGYTLSFSFTET